MGRAGDAALGSRGTQAGGEDESRQAEDAARTAEKDQLALAEADVALQEVQKQIKAAVIVHNGKAEEKISLAEAWEAHRLARAII